MTLKRKLAAIMFTDIVGYTALMSRDEGLALELLDRNREILKPIIEGTNGEWLKEIGDGTLSAFSSAVEAVQCAMEIQRSLASDQNLTLRIGIHIGDVVFRDGDVFGDGVNVASRIEPLAEPGGICVSERVFADIRNQAGIHTGHLGRKALKGFAEPVDVYTVFSAQPQAQDGPEQVDSGADGALPAIAVLPFVDMSPENDQGYFCDGMTEEIIDALARVDNLKVVARTSVFAFKDKHQDIRVIGNQLSVNKVLEGSIRKSGNRIRITVQLINVSDGFHLWSEKYDRELEDVFAIQDEIAQTIVNILKIKLVGDQAGVLVKRPTKNLDAYDYYLRGNHYLFRVGGRKDLRLAVQMFEKATDLDHGFALAYARLGAAHTDFYWLHFDRREERLALAKTAIVKALELDPDLPEAHGALGAYYYEGEQDYDRALKEVAIAQESQPNNSELVAMRGFIQRRRGKWEQALSYLKQASELDPRVSLFAQEVGDTYGYMRDYQEAERYLDRAISLTPDWLPPYQSKAWLYLRWEGSPEKARTVLEQVSEAMDSADPVIFYLWVLLDLYDGNYQAALERLSSTSSEAFESQFYFIPKAQLYAQIYGLLNQPKEEQAYYDSTQSLLEIKVQEQPEDARFHSALGIAFAGLGRKEEAIRAGKRSVDLMPISKDAWRGLFRVANLAHIYVMVGEHDAALDQIESLLSIPGELSVPLLRLDPAWAPLCDHPRYLALLEKYDGGR